MEINFIANEIVYEVTEYNSYLVGFADDKNEPKEYVIVERALEFDEQDIKLGMDSYYFEPFGCIANHIVSKGVEKRIKYFFPEMNILSLDFDSGVSDVNITNRLLLFVDHLK